MRPPSRGRIPPVQEAPAPRPLTRGADSPATGWEGICPHCMVEDGHVHRIWCRTRGVPTPEQVLEALTNRESDLRSKP